jgi:hypothetical protein
LLRCRRFSNGTSFATGYAPNNPYLNLEHLRSYLSSSRTLVFVRNMRHADLLAYPAFEQVLPGFSGLDVAADAHDGFVWMNRYTLQLPGRAFVQLTPR